jgi:hypothetical protein
MLGGNGAAGPRRVFVAGSGGGGLKTASGH